MKKIFFIFTILVFLGQNLYGDMFQDISTISSQKSLSLYEEKVSEADKSWTVSPRGSLEFYLKFWASNQYEKMYSLICEKYRKKNSYAYFVSLLEEDVELNGFITGYKIGSIPEEIGNVIRFKLEIQYNKRHEKNVIADIVYDGDGYYIAESGILPIDLNKL